MTLMATVRAVFGKLGALMTNCTRGLARHPLFIVFILASASPSSGQHGSASLELDLALRCPRSQLNQFGERLTIVGRAEQEAQGVTIVLKMVPPDSRILINTVLISYGLHYNTLAEPELNGTVVRIRCSNPERYCISARVGSTTDTLSMLDLHFCDVGVAKAAYEALQRSVSGAR